MTAATTSNCGLPVMAASRSTTWSRSAPSPSQLPGHGDGIAAVDRLVLELALLEPHHLAAADVDGGDDDHATAPRTRVGASRRSRTSSTKFSIRRRPTPWLFSGWNCTPRRCRARRRPGSRCRSPSSRSRPQARLAVVGVDEVDVGCRPRCRRAAGAPTHAAAGSSPCAGPASRPRSAARARAAGPGPVPAVLLALLEEQLHADADAQQRLPGRDRFADDAAAGRARGSRPSRSPKAPSPGRTRASAARSAAGSPVRRHRRAHVRNPW